MKNKIHPFKFLATLALLAMLSRGMTTAQIVPAFAPVWGTNYYDVLLNYQYQSNLASMYFTSHTLVITNLTTNTAYVAAYGFKAMGASASTMMPFAYATTNLNAAYGWTNGGTFVWTFTPQAYYPAVQPCAEFGISNASFPSGTITNMTQFQ